MSDTEKNLPPSWKKIYEARRYGRVAQSRDLSMALGMLAATGVLAITGPMVMGRLANHVAEMMRRMGELRAHELSATDLVPMVSSGGILIAIVAGPVALAAAGTSLFVSLLQTQFNFSLLALQPKFERLSPASGLQKLAPSKAGLDTLKTIVVATVLGILAWKAGKNLMADASRLAWSSPFVSAHRGWDDALHLLWQTGFVLLAFGVLDFGLQKYRMYQSLKMSHQEAKQEAREDSNPEVKSRIRKIQREMHRKRMLKAVPTATVIITNPTHFAVALEYNRAKNPAPIVVAKGADLVAAKIRAIARDHSVPIMENPALARALFKECEIGDTIPGPLFGAVAEVLAYLIRIKQLVL